MMTAKRKKAGLRDYGDNIWAYGSRSEPPFYPPIQLGMCNGRQGRQTTPKTVFTNRVNIQFAEETTCFKNLVSSQTILQDS
ncbi:hypothetical protein TNCV_1106721 [Trichonephila clavipes]|nr:hypothetical protein TNCV_1106721 [Trichonephila clavipes]